MGRMTHKDGPNPNHIGAASDPRYGKLNPQVWALQPHYSTFYCRNSVKKRCFFDLKTVFYIVVEFWVSMLVGCGWLYTIFGPYVPHTLTYMRLNFQTGAMKSQFAAFFYLNFGRFLTFFGLFFNFDIFMT